MRARGRICRALALPAGALVAALLLSGAASAGGGGTARLLVGFTSGTTGGAKTRTLTLAGATDRATIRGIGVHLVTVPAGSAASVLARLHANSHVSFAERDGVAKPQDILPGDPSFPQTYAIAGGAWGWYQTHTTQAWDITKGDPSVVVAVLDTGLKTQGLADFSGQVVSGWNVLNNSTDTASGAGNHGTYVAGVVGLALDNGVGNAGFCPRCKIMPVQVGT